MDDGKTLHPKSGLHRDIDRLFRRHALKKGWVTPEEIEQAESLKKECSDDIAPWLHHALIAQNVLTEKQVKDALREIRWADPALGEKVGFLRKYMGNMDTITDIHNALLHGEKATEAVPVPPKAPAPPTAPPVEIVERMIISFQIAEEIASDPLSKTYRAADRLTGKMISLRILLEKHKESRDTVNLFLYGAKVLANLEHPNVLPVSCVGVMRTGQPFIAKPYF
ncbi:MAG: hypothetical protein ACYTHM_22600, partial [Planctomycetota bacterium]